MLCFMITGPLNWKIYQKKLHAPNMNRKELIKLNRINNFKFKNS